MAEPTPPLTADRPGEPLVYRPLAGLAIVGVVSGGLYALLVVFSVVMGLLRHEPFFLPSWLIALALLGAGASVLALRQIRHAEGTRAGATLARLGLWLSVLAGLGYVTYSSFTGLAIRQQADRFLTEKGADSGFFPDLLEGRTNAAYLLTVPPRMRRDVNPHDSVAMERLHNLSDTKGNPKGKLTQFGETGYVRLLRPFPGEEQARPGVQVKAMGLRGWAYEGKGYKVERVYRITTPEAEFELPIAVQSVDGEIRGEGRTWRVLWNGPQAGIEGARLTPLGEKMRKVRTRALQFLHEFFRNLEHDPKNPARRLEAYLLTREPAQRAALRKAAAVVTAMPALRDLALAGGAAGCAPGGSFPVLTVPVGTAIPPEKFARELLPGWVKFATGYGCVSSAHVHAPGGAVDEQLRPMLARFLLAGGLQREPIMPDRQIGMLSPWRERDGKLEVSVEVELTLANPFPRSNQVTGLLVVGRALLSTDKDIDPDRPESENAWRLERLDLERAFPALAGASGP